MKKLMLEHGDDKKEFMVKHPDGFDVPIVLDKKGGCNLPMKCYGVREGLLGKTQPTCLQNEKKNKPCKVAAGVAPGRLGAMRRP